MPRSTRLRVLPTVALLALTACASGPDPEGPADDSSLSTGATNTYSTAGDAASCSPADMPNLSEVTLTDAGDELRIKWTTNGSTGTETTLWAVSISDADYVNFYQVGVKQIGSEISVFAFDFTDAQQENLDSTLATVEPKSVEVAVPWSELGDMTGDLSWSASLSADGTDLAICPSPGADLINPAKATLIRG